MPTPDAGPLAGVQVAVAGDDPALRHARLLLSWLGANVLARPEPTVLLDITCAPGSAADDWARSGAMALTGRRDGPPLPAPGAPASAVRGALLVRT